MSCAWFYAWRIHSLDDVLCYVSILVLCLQASIALMMFCDMPCAWFYSYRVSQPWWCFVTCLVHGFILAGFHNLDDVLWYVLCMVLCLQAITALMMFCNMWCYAYRIPQPWPCDDMSHQHCKNIYRPTQNRYSKISGTAFHLCHKSIHHSIKTESYDRLKKVVFQVAGNNM